MCLLMSITLNYGFQHQHPTHEGSLTTTHTKPVFNHISITSIISKRWISLTLFITHIQQLFGLGFWNASGSHCSLDETTMCQRDLQLDFFPQSLKEIGIPYTEVLHKYNPDHIISVQRYYLGFTMISRKGLLYITILIAVSHIWNRPHSKAPSAKEQSWLLKCTLVHNELLAAVFQLKAITCCFCWACGCEKSSSADEQGGERHLPTHSITYN